MPRSTGEKPATVLTEIVAPAQSVHPDAELDMKTKQILSKDYEQQLDGFLKSY